METPQLIVALPNEKTGLIAEAIRPAVLILQSTTTVKPSRKTDYASVFFGAGAFSAAGAGAASAGGAGAAPSLAPPCFLP
jgi:hypothetical protein